MSLSYMLVGHTCAHSLAADALYFGQSCRAERPGNPLVADIALRKRLFLDSLEMLGFPDGDDADLREVIGSKAYVDIDRL